MNNEVLLGKILVIPAILVAFTVKGWVQAKTAIKLGDNTPKQYGRDTFNPLKHIDIAGFIFMLILSFGWTKPMQIDRRNFKNYYKDDLKVRLLGVGANLAVGFIATIIYIAFATNAKVTDLNVIITMIILNIARLNCTWFMLNLLPVPGFEGFNIIVDIMGDKARNFVGLVYKYNLVIFLILIMPIIGGNSILDFVVGIPGHVIFSSFCKVAFLIF